MQQGLNLDLDSLAQPHLISQNPIEVIVVQGHQPSQATQLIPGVHKVSVSRRLVKTQEEKASVTACVAKELTLQNRGLHPRLSSRGR